MEIFSDYHVMIFDDDPYMAKLLSTILTSYEVGKIEVVSDLEEAKLYLRSTQVDCVMLEWEGWEVPTLDLLLHIRKSGKVLDPMLPVVMCTGYTDIDHVIKARDLGVNEIVSKPLSPVQVYEKFYSAMFKVRDFIHEKSFTGPDRRRHIEEYTGDERRAGKALPQSDIDQLMVEKDG